FSRFYSEEEQHRGEPARALHVAAYEGKCAVEGWRVRRDKSLFWASAVIEAVRDEAGTLVGFVNITRDITERRESQASLERAQEQLAQSQKMEALGQLTGSIAHDFNNLLMIVSGHAQLLRRRLTDPKHLQAIDAMPGGGSITLSARNVSVKKSDAVDQLEGDFVALAMTDTGVGIAPDVLPRIFEPFFTTKALGKGTGLGLAQVYGFSHQSGGTVVATSTAGSGTSITIYLPRKQASIVRSADTPPTQPIAPGEGTVLMVEDNPEVADVTAS